MINNIQNTNPNSPKYGTFMNDGIRRIDFVLVFKEEESEEEEAVIADDDKRRISRKQDFESRRQYYEQHCRKEGLEMEIEKVTQKDETLIFVKVHVPWPTLCKHADELRIKTPLWVHDRSVRKNYLAQNKKRQIFDSEPNSNEHPPERKLRMFSQNTLINWPFSRKHVERYAVRDKNTFFTPKQRTEIAYEILQKVPNNPKDKRKRGIEILLREKIYESAYPLHDGDIDVETLNPKQKPLRQDLNETWSNWRKLCYYQPLTDIRNYFGERIGFYYAFMECYTRMLIFPSIVGILMFIIGIITTAHNPEISEICTIKHPQEYSEESLQNEIESSIDKPALNHHSISMVQAEDENAVAEYWMCPICKPPNCEAWEMFAEGCHYYTWAYRMDNGCSFVISAFTTLWAIIFIKLWKRREASLAVQWDVKDAEEHEYVVRPEYEDRAPSHRKNPITLEEEPFVPFSKKFLWMLVSVLATVLFLLFACACLIVLVISRIQLYGVLRKVGGIIGEKHIDFARWLTHLFLFILVTIFEKAYGHFAHKLTIFECPRTEKQFMNSLLWKIFIFAMLNDIIPIGYAAWMKGQTVRTPLDLNLIDEFCDGGCIGEVTELVAVLLLARLIVGNFTEIGIPLIQKFWKHFRMHKGAEEKPHVPQYVKDFHLNEVEFDGVYEEYMEMMVQFAFIVLFIPALPVAPFVCFLNNVAEIRVDSIKMIRTNRRPLPIRVSGIGIWNRFLDILSRLGIVFNAALLAFTSDNVPRLYYKYIYNPGFGDLGFTKFSLSKMMVKAFNDDGRREMEEKNITECWYPSFRFSHYPYDLKGYYWEIVALRTIIFTLYCTIFLIITWFINTFVSDTPEDVKTKIKRQNYIVTKSFEAESTINESKKAVTNAVTAWTTKISFKQNRTPSVC